jgi:hypothetical protein
MTLKKHLAGLILLSALLLAGASGATQAQKADHKTTAGKSQSASQVDINSASEKELDTLPGVGPATAKKIIGARPYSSPDDLSRAGLKPAAIQKLTPLVKVGPAASTPGAAPSQASKQAGGAITNNSAGTIAPPSKATAAAAVSHGSPGPGMVWVNKDTKVYHKQGDRWYGNTKNGQYMTEGDAIRAGYHAAKVTPAKK